MKAGKLRNALRGLEAYAVTEANLSLPGIAGRNPKLIKRLEGFSFPAIANAAGGLLTLPENQPATFRIEALVCLAAVYARGIKVPTAAHLREWLNDILLSDPIGQFEDAVEDVFVSNVPSWKGNARLLDGLWGDNDTSVEAAVWAVMKLKEEKWAHEALDCCMALLSLSEAVAERAGVTRYSTSPGKPVQPVRVTTAELGRAKAHVLFPIDDLFQLGLRAKRLAPFGLLDTDRAEIAAQTLGATNIERKPLVWDGANIIVALPTAIGAAIRRFVLEQAKAAGRLDAVEEIIRDVQFSEIHEFTLVGLEARTIRGAELFAGNCYDLIATFDEGAYLHLVYVSDTLSEVLDNGLRSLHNVRGEVVDRTDTVAAEMAANGDYRRGLTIMVNGGVGRGFAVGFTKPAPQAWHRVALGFADIARFGWEHGFHALRMWKIEYQESQLPARGYELQNVNGFANLYGYLRSHGMAMVQDDASPGLRTLAPGHVGGIRNFLRSTLDAHVVMSPQRDRWIEVRRSATDVFFEEVKNLPLYTSPADLATGTLASCVETAVRPWWVSAERSAATPIGRNLQYQFWDMAQNWMVRAAPRLDGRFPALPSGPMSYRLKLPGVDGFQPDKAFATTEFGKPKVDFDDGMVAITCNTAQLAAFARAENVAERQIIAAFATGAAMIAGVTIDDSELEAFALEVAGSNKARFLHMIPPRTPGMLVYAAADLKRPRLLQDEDVAWGRLGLAQLAGWRGSPGVTSAEDAPEVLKAAVDEIWKRMKGIMKGLDRDSLVKMALMNHDAAAWDRHNWGQTASALLALYDDAVDVIAASNRLEAQRGIAGLGSRVIVEMAVCTSLEAGGATATQADFDALLADVAILIECANQADAIHWKLAATLPKVNGNGSLSFDTSFLEREQRPYVEAHGELSFRGAARSYAGLFSKSGEPRELGLDPRFLAAIETEWGLTIEAFARFVTDISIEAAAQGTNVLRLKRSEVVERLGGDPEDFPAADAGRAYDTLTLKPRAQWDEPKPVGAKKRDWYPWRFSRRLSLLQRPIVQIGTDADPLVLVLPTLMDNFVQRLFMAESGSVPVDLYTTTAMRSWIGTAVDRDGHEFNRLVAAKLEDNGWNARSDVKITELGGTKAMGDVDVLAWHVPSGVVVAIECKRLQMARSIGEIGERLAEYGEVAPAGAKRTPIQKHLDRLDFLRDNSERLARTTHIPIERVLLRSALVTDHLVPMQFSKRAGALVDVIADFDAIATLLAPEELATRS